MKSDAAAYEAAYFRKKQKIFSTGGIIVPVIRCINSFLTYFGTNRDRQKLRGEVAVTETLEKER